MKENSAGSDIRDAGGGPDRRPADRQIEIAEVMGKREKRTDRDPRQDRQQRQSRPKTIFPLPPRQVGGAGGNDDQKRE